MQAYRAAVFLAYGSTNFSKSAFEKHKKTFNAADTDVDLSGVNVVVTGANAGLGRSAAQQLAAKGATVYALCRNPEKGHAAVEDIRAKTGNQNVHLEVLDMASLQQIREYAKKYTDSGKPLHILINNAGVMVQERTKSPDGLEMNFAVNVAGVVALTEQMLPALEKAAPNAKVISVATGGIYTEPLYHDLQMESMQKFDGTTAYARNKRIQLAVTEKWTELYGSRGIGFYCTHPGWVDTATLAEAMPGFYKTFKNQLRNPDDGADTTSWLAIQPNSNLIPGGFYFDRTSVQKHLWGAGTEYKPSDVNSLYDKIKKLSGLS